MRAKAYADRRWNGEKGVRIMYLREHPLCERCLSKGIVKAGEHVHHRKSPFKGDEVDWALFLDYNNLETVCAKCHTEIHNEEMGHINPARMIEVLDALFEDVEDK